jgi:hypothetical protein
VNERRILRRATRHIWIFAIVAISLLAVWYWAVSAHVVSQPVAADGTKINLLRSGWNYTPGVSARTDGLHVGYLGRAIFQQDGASGQANPALNIYGTHLRTGSGITLNATAKDKKASA